MKVIQSISQDGLTSSKAATTMKKVICNDCHSISCSNGQLLTVRTRNFDIPELNVSDPTDPYFPSKKVCRMSHDP